MVTLYKNMEVEIDITGYTSDGSGVGRYGDAAVFVPLCAKGDRVKALIIKVAQSYAVGKLLEIISPSPDRVTEECPVFSRCGGCSFWQISYEAEKRAKWQTVRDAFLRVGKLDIEPGPIIGADSVFAYRNKAAFPVAAGKDGAESGFYARRSHSVVSAESCPIQSPEANLVKRLTLDFMNSRGISAYDEKSGTGLVRHIFVRTGKEVGITLVINGDSLPFSEEYISLMRKNIDNLAGISLSINKKNTNIIMGEEIKTIWGRPGIKDTLCGLDFEISPLSFYQVNHSQCERLYELALSLGEVSESDVCLDLYCGIGTITLMLARRAKKVFGVEIVPQAIENAKEAARENGIKNARFICADAGKAAKELAGRGERITLLTVDPPRAGLDSAVIDAMLKIAPDRILYISCNPATLARDLAILTQNGYLVKAAVPVDLFPRTPHVETVVLMSRVDK